MSEWDKMRRDAAELTQSGTMTVLIRYQLDKGNLTAMGFVNMHNECLYNDMINNLI